MVPRGLLNIDWVVQNFSNQAFPPIILILIRGILFIVIKGLHKFIVHCLFPQVPDVRMKKALGPTQTCNEMGTFFEYEKMFTFSKGFKHNKNLIAKL